MSWRQIRTKGCIDPRKQCRYGNGQTQTCRHLQKYEEHPIWEQRRKLRIQRKLARKDRRRGERFQKQN
jgi:hypothetical protein